MKRKRMIRIKWGVFSLIACLFFSNGCEKSSSTGYLTIERIEYKEVFHKEILDLPNGTYKPDNPNFHINDPKTWTGNMAQYVKADYGYSITYQIRNSGGNFAYDSEIDLYYTFDNGDVRVETIYIGDIRPGISIHRSISASSLNKELIECSGEVFWYD